MTPRDSRGKALLYNEVVKVFRNNSGENYPAGDNWATTGR